MNETPPHAALTLVSHGKNGEYYHAQQWALTLGDSIAISESQTKRQP